MNWFWDNVLLKKEDRHSFVLFCCIIFLILLSKWYLVVHYNPIQNKNIETTLNSIEYTTLSDERVHYSAHSKKNEPLSIQHTNRGEPSSPEATPKAPSTKKSNFKFDPNSLSKDSLMMLGISAYAASNMLKYREKGGRFSNPNQLRKIYGMDSLFVNELLPFVQIKSAYKIDNESERKTKPKYVPKPPVAVHSIPINSASSEVFMTLKGIGPVYANRIIKFRNLLGGFISVEQIKEVWGISDSLYQEVKPYLTVDPSQVVKRNINEFDKESMVKHPYIDWKKAKVITKYKQMHGPYKSMNDFKKLHGIDPSFVDTLAFYFEAR